MRELIHKAIVEALRMEGISEAVIDRYMADAGEIQFSKTANKSLVAKLNKAVKDVYWVGEYLDSSTPIQRYFSIQAGRMPQNLPYDEFYYPINELLKYLEDRYADVTGGVRQPVDVQHPGERQVHRDGLQLAHGRELARQRRAVHQLDGRLGLGLRARSEHGSQCEEEGADAGRGHGSFLV